MEKKKRIIRVCLILLCLLFVIGWKTEKGMASELFYDYYNGIGKAMFPVWHKNQQSVPERILLEMVKAYRSEIVPVLQYNQDYKKTTGKDLVSGNYLPEYDEETDMPVEETEKEGRKFYIKKWESPYYLRKYIYQIDSTTTVTNGEINGKDLLNMNLKLKKEKTPQVLIYHTHGSEAYKDSRAGKKGDTVIGVGDELSKKLSQKGISVLHDRNVYDMRGGKEERSKAYNYAADAIEKKLKKYPGIQVIIDLHRDGVKESTKLVTKQNGRQMAQIMFFNGISRTARNGDIPYLKNPNKKKNLAFSLKLQAQAMKEYPGFVRKIYIKGYRYNLHYRGRSLLVEVGAQNNTVKQAKASMSLLAELLNNVLY